MSIKRLLQSRQPSTSRAPLAVTTLERAAEAWRASLIPSCIQTLGVPLGTAEFPPDNPSFWGPAWGPTGPFSAPTSPNRDRGGPAIPVLPLPHHQACGSAPGGSVS